MHFKNFEKYTIYKSVPTIITDRVIPKPEPQYKALIDTLTLVRSGDLSVQPAAETIKRIMRKDASN